MFAYLSVVCFTPLQEHGHMHVCMTEVSPTDFYPTSMFLDVYLTITDTNIMLLITLCHTVSCLTRVCEMLWCMLAIDRAGEPPWLESARGLLLGRLCTWHNPAKWRPGHTASKQTQSCLHSACATTQVNNAFMHAAITLICPADHANATQLYCRY